jgi:hypothetical protein
VEAHGYNHNLQVYKHAALHPSQGNITRVPMNTQELHGLVDGGHHRNKELHGESEFPFCKPFFTAIGLFTSISLPPKGIPGCIMLHYLIKWLP